jgi:serine/threonine-protein kinase
MVTVLFQEHMICPKCATEFNKNSEVEYCNICNSKLLLNNRYFLTEILSNNKIVTYLGIDTLLDKKTIIKELKIDSLKDWKILELFLREVSTLKMLNHNRVPKLIANFNIENNHYLVMEFINGITLEEQSKLKRYTELMVLALTILIHITVIA